MYYNGKFQVHFESGTEDTILTKYVKSTQVREIEVMYDEDYIDLTEIDESKLYIIM